ADGAALRGKCDGRRAGLEAGTLRVVADIGLRGGGRVGAAPVDGPVRQAGVPADDEVETRGVGGQHGAVLAVVATADSEAGERGVAADRDATADVGLQGHVALDEDVETSCEGKRVGPG